MATFPVKIVDVEPVKAMPFGIDLENARRRTLLQPVKKQAGEQKRSQVIDAKHGFEPFRRVGQRRRVKACAVDQDIDHGMPLQYR